MRAWQNVLKKLPQFLLVLTIVGMEAGDRQCAHAETAVPATATAAGAESAEAVQARRSAAVAINYSRASLHRIRKAPNIAVMIEEQEKILNHLNLNGVADEEVIRLYSSVLDEISHVQIADRERVMLHQKHRRAIRSMITGNAFALTAQMATMQYLGAVQTGASSWWDYRNITVTREMEEWKVEKDRWNAVVQKSNQFLDVSWKMARTRQIPDRWLVRGDDLDRLEEGWKEPDPEVRLRVLKRMEPFMECYPPYWYYVARTEQALGKLSAAAETYGKLANLGDGHFRRDEMLATGLANQALIQAHLRSPEAPETARRALAQCTDAWEANLVCAAVLQNSGQIADAEDAILRNLDVGLEESQSELVLLGLYYHQNDTTKLAQRLSQPEVAQRIPGPVLVQCATRLQQGRVPNSVTQQLASSLQITPRYHFGSDDLVVTAGPNWDFSQASLSVHVHGVEYRQPTITRTRDAWVAVFQGVGELGTSLSESSGPQGVQVALQYPQSERITLWMTPTSTDGGSSGVLFAQRAPQPFRPTLAQWGTTRLSLVPGTVLPTENAIVSTTPVPQPVELIAPVVPGPQPANSPVPPGEGIQPHNVAKQPTLGITTMPVSRPISIIVPPPAVPAYPTYAPATNQPVQLGAPE